MLARVLETLLDLAAGGGWARGMIAAEAANHEGIGVAPDRFPLFVVAVADAFRDALGDEWTPDDERAWRWATESVAALSARA
jgi:hemoglobin-like flavoprotein